MDRLVSLEITNEDGTFIHELDDKKLKIIIEGLNGIDLMKKSKRERQVIAELLKILS